MAPKPPDGKAARAYDGTWNVVFATTRGNCSSGYSVPFTVRGLSRFVGRRWQGFGFGQSRRGGCGQGFGRRIQGERRRPARRHLWSGRMARHHHRRSLQRHLAGHAELSANAVPGLRFAPSGLRETKTARRIIRRAALNSSNSNQRGASTITTWRPSKRASCSTLANSATSALTLSKSLVPISWCAISRPR